MHSNYTAPVQCTVQRGMLHDIAFQFLKTSKWLLEGRGTNMFTLATLAVESFARNK